MATDSVQLVSSYSDTSDDVAEAGQNYSIEATPSFQLLDRDKWQTRMPLPDDEQIRAYRADTRSPYIVCWPEFPGAAGYYEYAVDFKADSQPGGTYVNIGSWWMDTSCLRDRYVDVSADEGRVPGGGYAGFQVYEDGRKVAIMSIWNIYATDESGNATTIHATRTYPENPLVGADFAGEGTGVQTVVDYDWQAGRTYRALIQCGQTAAGNCELVFWVCDLATGQWDQLVAYDLGYGSTCIDQVCCFLENYLVEYASEVRAVEWSNFRANSREAGTWVSATSACMERQFDSWVGSYAYGSDGACFWAVTTAVPNLCEAPPNGERYYVSDVLEGSPF